MTTVHHPPLKGVDFHDYHSWLWIGLAVVLVVLAIAAIAWSMTNASLEDATFAESTGVAEAEGATTPAQYDIKPGVEAPFVGVNAGPDPVYTEYDEATSPAIFEMGPGVVPLFVGASAGPDVVFTEFDEATSPARFDIKPGVISWLHGAKGDADATWDANWPH